jgi:hypothetical protein
MNKVTSAISMSLDGFVAGPNQSLEKPFGDIPQDLLLRRCPHAAKAKGERRLAFCNES